MNNLELSKKYFDLGLLQFENSRFLEAENNFNSALKLTPGRLSILTNLSATLIKSYKYESLDKNPKEYEVDKILGKHIITHLQEFFNKSKRNKTLKNRGKKRNKTQRI